MRRLFAFLILAAGFIFCFFPDFCFAAGEAVVPPFAKGGADSDGDGARDAWEVDVFGADPNKSDTDGDGYDDLTEIINGYDPRGRGQAQSGDFDKDGLADNLEILFGSDPTVSDYDGDGFTDGLEVSAGYSPTSTSDKPLIKSIEIRLKEQKLYRILGGIRLASYSVSTGVRRLPTPKGEFKIISKTKRAWSKSARLWMPWWMQFSPRGLGIHELPEWPGGKKEGADHLGKPASHGCVRLGIGPAKTMYDWTPIGTTVKIVN